MSEREPTTQLAGEVEEPLAVEGHLARIDEIGRAPGEVERRLAPVEPAKNLAAGRFWSLRLLGLTRMPVRIASELAAFQGDLYPGVRQLTEETARFIARLRVSPLCQSWASTTWKNSRRRWLQLCPRSGVPYSS